MMPIPLPSPPEQRGPCVFSANAVRRELFRRLKFPYRRLRFLAADAVRREPRADAQIEERLRRPDRLAFCAILYRKYAYAHFLPLRNWFVFLRLDRGIVYKSEERVARARAPVSVSAAARLRPKRDLRAPAALRRHDLVGIDDPLDYRDVTRAVCASFRFSAAPYHDRADAGGGVRASRLKPSRVVKKPLGVHGLQIPAAVAARDLVEPAVRVADAVREDVALGVLGLALYRRRPAARLFRDVVFVPRARTLEPRDKFALLHFSSLICSGIKPVNICAVALS